MTRVGLWQITDNGPSKVSPTAIDLERDLEDWIERDPGLIQSDLKIVGRQLSTSAGPLDLLAVDAQGRWVLVEIKRGAVRRETITQALDYASAIAEMPLDELQRKVDEYFRSRGTAETLEHLMQERQGGLDTDGEFRIVDIIVVGTARDSGLDRIVNYLSRSDFQITVVAFEVFDIEPGRRVLVRELTEADTPRTPEAKKFTVDRVLARADEKGVGTIARPIHELATRLGLYARPWKTSISYTPPSNRSRTLVTAWTDRSRDAGGIWVYVSADAFQEFYGVDPAQVLSSFDLSQDGYMQLTLDVLPEFSQKLEAIFDSVGE